jgi:hypothetical protein
MRNCMYMHNCVQHTHVQVLMQPILRLYTYKFI